MTPDVHRMIAEARRGGEVLFTCPHGGCGRRLVLTQGGGLVVLDRGRFEARHVGVQGPDGVSFWVGASVESS